MMSTLNDNDSASHKKDDFGVNSTWAAAISAFIELIGLLGVSVLVVGGNPVAAYNWAA